MKSVVLLSSGLDSTVNLYEALQLSAVVLAITFDYGQRAAEPERRHSAAIAKRAGVVHKIVELPFFASFTSSSLVDRSVAVPTGDNVRIDDQAASERSAKAVWVPNRNGVFLSIAAGFAEGLGAKWIVPGFNAEEAATFPDNSVDFIRAANEAFRFSTANGVEARCFTLDLEKPAIYARGLKLKAPLDLVWPCYFGAEQPCGECESCLRFRRAKGV